MEVESVDNPAPDDQFCFNNAAVNLTNINQAADDKYRSFDNQAPDDQFCFNNAAVNLTNINQAADSRPRAAMMVSVPKKLFKRAVKRNLLKRRTREAYRLNKHILDKCGEKSFGSDEVGNVGSSGNKTLNIAFIYSAKVVENFNTIENGIKRILKKVGGNS